MKTKYLFFSVLFVFIVWGIVACKDDDGLDMPVELFNWRKSNNF